MSESWTWTCPYCGQPQQGSGKNYSLVAGRLSIGQNALGDLYFAAAAVACLNEACQQPSITATLSERTTNGSGYDRAGSTLSEWRLLPEPTGKPQPAYIPTALRQDYEEACRIAGLSPKASATLIRRCLQGMIRDFCGISDRTLYLEIQRLKEAVVGGFAPRGVTHESVDAIDQVRSIGNIGAHMEADVNQIIDIDPGEASVLIELVEMLFEEWYIERQKRAERLAKIAALKAEKEALKAQGGVQLAMPAVSAIPTGDNGAG